MRAHRSWKCLIGGGGVLLVLLLMSGMAQARTVRMIFWYPGEAGSTAEAQPILDEFFRCVNTKIAPDIVTGRYFNTVEAGRAWLSKEKPDVGIVSYAAWAQEKIKPAGATVLLQALPLPHGKATEQYVLVSGSGQVPAGAQVLSSEPLSAAFVRGELFPALPADATVVQTPQLLMKLKEIGDGKLSAAAILTPVEADTLARVSAAWSQGVRRVAVSTSVPTARVILFDAGWKDAEKFKAALLGAGSDPKAKDILQEMRLSGFAL